MNSLLLDVDRTESLSKVSSLESVNLAFLLALPVGKSTCSCCEWSSVCLTVFSFLVCACLQIWSNGYNVHPLDNHKY